MTYVDCFMAAVPEANKSVYLTQAKMMAGMMKEHGALSIYRMLGGGRAGGQEDLHASGRDAQGR